MYLLWIKIGWLVVFVLGCLQALSLYGHRVLLLTTMLEAFIVSSEALLWIKIKMENNSFQF
jgi:hypothetical protein